MIRSNGLPADLDHDDLASVAALDRDPRGGELAEALEARAQN
jgi:hypothetical protein